MSVSLVHCPECNTLLLGDTLQCPTCHHVLDEKRAASAVPPEKEPVGTSVTHDACPGCGEMVRRGLVRCFNCGTFMRGEIAQSYQRLKSTPSQVIYSEVGEKDKDQGTDTDLSEAAKKASQTYQYEEPASSATDDDFELGPDVVADEEDFDEDFEIEPEQSNKVFDEVDVAYKLLQDEQEEQEATKRAQIEAAQKAAEEEAARVAKVEEDEDETNSRRDRFSEENDEAYSGTAGGDVLLKVALEEEAEVGRKRLESGQRRGEGGVSTGIMVYCPNGHRVEVQERHRGKTGRCPRCREPFIVPAGPWHEEQAEPVKKPEAEEEDLLEKQVEAAYKVKAGEYTYYLRDVQYHAVDVSKLKLKPGSLEKAFELVDLACAPFGMLIVSLAKKKSGLFASSKKQDPGAVRDAVIEHLADEKPLEQLPAGEHKLLSAEDVKKIRIVQPAPTEYESMFAGIPVFGKGIVAVRYAKNETDTEQKFASFAISDFRAFAEAMREVFEIKNFGADCGIPLTNVHTELKCHYGETIVKSLEQVEYYQADKAYTLQLTGRKCAECGLVVSEEARKKEKLGGANGKGIAKAKCPKCGKKFGDISLFAIEKGPDIGAEKVEESHRE